jgi:uncharacterized membrane protein
MVICVMMGMGLWMLLGLLMLLAALGVAAYVGAQAAGLIKPRRETARELLDRRLAAGELSPEEYFERESALRTQ